VICPNKGKPDVKEAAVAKIAETKVKRKAQRKDNRARKKQRIKAYSAFENLTDDQQALCIATATQIIATSATSATIQPSSDSN
jgi:hypothetical protein